MNELSPICTQLDISANSMLTGTQAAGGAGNVEQTLLLRELVAGPGDRRVVGDGEHGG